MIRHHTQDLGCIGFVYLYSQCLFPCGSLLIHQEPCQFFRATDIQMIGKGIAEFSCVAEHLRRVFQLAASLEYVLPVRDRSIHPANGFQIGASGEGLLPDLFHGCRKLYFCQAPGVRKATFTQFSDPLRNGNIFDIRGCIYHFSAFKKQFRNFDDNRFRRPRRDKRLEEIRFQIDFQSGANAESEVHVVAAVADAAVAVDARGG